jgi:hypothetical protein
MAESLTKLERTALDVALSGSAAWLTALRAQVPSLRVAARRYTGFGFYTDLVCEGGLIRLFVGEAFRTPEPGQARASVKRSPNSTAN